MHSALLYAGELVSTKYDPPTSSCLPLTEKSSFPPFMLTWLSLLLALPTRWHLLSLASGRQIDCQLGGN